MIILYDPSTILGLIQKYSTVLYDHTSHTTLLVLFPTEKSIQKISVVGKTHSAARRRAVLTLNILRCAIKPQIISYSTPQTQLTLAGCMEYYITYYLIKVAASSFLTGSKEFCKSTDDPSLYYTTTLC
jgi:hypothetical protein